MPPNLVAAVPSVLVAARGADGVVVVAILILSVLEVPQRPTVAVLVAAPVEIAIVLTMVLAIELGFALALTRALDRSIALEASKPLLLELLLLQRDLLLASALETPLALHARNLGGPIVIRRRCGRTHGTYAASAIGLLHALLAVDHATIQDPTVHDLAIHDATVSVLAGRRVDAALPISNPIADRAWLARSDLCDRRGGYPERCDDGHQLQSAHLQPPI